MPSTKVQVDLGSWTDGGPRARRTRCGRAGAGRRRARARAERHRRRARRAGACSPSRRSALGLEVDLREHDLAALRAHPGHPGEEAPRDSLWGLTATLPGRAPGRLCLNGHVDVVGPGNEQWRHGPWSGVLEDGRLHGRGALDMKGAVVAAMHAVAALRAVDAPEVVLQAVSSEEDGGLGTFAALERDARFDAALLPEPTALRVVCAQAGALTFRGVVRGPRRARGRAARGRVGDRSLRARPRGAAGPRGGGQRGRLASADARAGAAVPAAGRAGSPAASGRAWCRTGSSSRAGSGVPVGADLDAARAGAAGRRRRRAGRRRAAVRAGVGGRRVRAGGDGGRSPVGGDGAGRVARRDRAAPSWPACPGARTCGSSPRAGFRR